MLQPLPRVRRADPASVALCGKKADPAEGQGRCCRRTGGSAHRDADTRRRQGRRFNFIYEDGGPLTKRRAPQRSKKDWAARAAQCEAALAKDPHAPRCASPARDRARADRRDAAAAVDHLVDRARRAITTRTGRRSRATGSGRVPRDAAGPGGAALAQQIHDEYAKRIKGALWVVGRRSTFMAEKSGVQSPTAAASSTRTTATTKRYFRLTHTDHQVAAFVRAGGTRSRCSASTRSIMPADGSPPSFAHPWLEVHDGDQTLVGKRISLPAGKQIALGYGAGDALVVAVDGPGGAASSRQDDRQADEDHRRAAGAAIEATLEEVTARPRARRRRDGVERRSAGDLEHEGRGWRGDRDPRVGAGATSAIAVAPSNAKVAFATWVNPCAKDTAPSLYVADAKTGALKHLLTAHSRFDTRWLDATTLAYEDGDSAIRLWDATTGREALRLDERGGLALDALAISASPVCKQAPAVEAGSGSAEEPLPPEEGSAGPVTSPQ